jgi:hypothetical protein
MFWRGTAKIIWTDGVRNEVLHRVKEARNILPTIQSMKTDWIRHILRRNCLLIYVIVAKIDEKLK